MLLDHTHHVCHYVWFAIGVKRNRNGGRNFNGIFFWGSSGAPDHADRVQNFSACVENFTNFGRANAEKSATSAAHLFATWDSQPGSVGQFWPAGTLQPAPPA